MVLNQSGLLFVPQRWQRANVLRWLKRIHAWTGFWGALLFFVMGASGFLLNHRSILKIDTGAPTEVSAIEVAVQPGQFKDADALAKWAKARLDLKVDGKAPQAKPEGEKRFRATTLPQAEMWTRVFTLPDAKITVAYGPGAPNVSMKTEAVGLLGTMKNLHKGTGLGVVDEPDWLSAVDAAPRVAFACGCDRRRRPCLGNWGDRAVFCLTPEQHPRLSSNLCKHRP
jgi:uncharacterized protein